MCVLVAEKRSIGDGIRPKPRLSEPKRKGAMLRDLR